MSDTPDGQGVKFDGAKVRMELLPPELMFGTAAVLTYGAEKYEDRNWERGMKWSRVYGALQRHLLSWWSGEDTDADTEMPHLWHASCCLAFLMAYDFRRAGEDDRPAETSGADFYGAEVQNALLIMDAQLVSASSVEPRDEGDTGGL